MVARNEQALRKGRSLDQESQAMIYEGLNLTQMEQLFEMDIRDLKRKIAQGKVQPCGQRGNSDVYRLKDVMPWVVKPLYDVETYIRNMNPSELPKTLSKEYWAGQRSRQEYQIKAGNLWPTEKVIENVGEVFKIVKMNLSLSIDTVERSSELSERQRQIFKNIIDGTLNDLAQTIQERFKQDNEEGIPDGDEDEDEEL
jgi:hypothetical protein